MESGKGNLPDFPVSAYDEVPAGILLPSSGAFQVGSTREPAGKRRKKRRFRRDLSGSSDQNHRPGIMCLYVSIVFYSS